jgi:5-methyltetrahydrofolate--homocysteine methyltransferase
LLVADGAMGTMLQAAGLPAGDAPERWNLEHPDKVADVQRAYVEAGAEMVLTNTLGAFRLALRHIGFESRVADCNRAAIRIARRVAPIVGVSVGPSGEMTEPLGELPRSELFDNYAEQMAACGEADVIWIETISDADEARVAVDAARQETDLPVVLTFTFDAGARGIRSMMGVSPEEVAESFGDVDALGVNCTTPQLCLDALTVYRERLPEMPLVARPNAGRPRFEHGRTVFPSTPTLFLDEVRPLMERVVVLGGCCGTTPEHIRLIASSRLV